MGKELLPSENDFGWKSNLFKNVLDNYIAKADARRSRELARARRNALLN